MWSVLPFIILVLSERDFVIFPSATSVSFSFSKVSCISFVISYTLGTTAFTSFESHFSRASCIIVWFVYEKVAFAILSASSKLSCSSSTSSLISSGIAIVGWVSLSCTALYFAKSLRSFP